jgi:diguanylate cyclase (GGDEF)-like protein/PAS domain S-box-containing protein
MALLGHIGPTQPIPTLTAMSVEPGALAAPPIAAAPRILRPPGRLLLLAVAMQVVLVPLGMLAPDRAPVPWGELQLALAAVSAIFLIERGRATATGPAEQRFRGRIAASTISLAVLETMRLADDALPRELTVPAELSLLGLVVVGIIAGWAVVVREGPDLGDAIAVHLDAGAVFFTVAGGILLFLGGHSTSADPVLLALAIFFGGLIGGLMVLYLALAPKRRPQGWPPMLLGAVGVTGGFAWQVATAPGSVWHPGQSIAAVGMLLATYGAATWTPERDDGTLFQTATRLIREALPLVTISLAPVLLIANELLFTRDGESVALGIDLAIGMVLILSVMRQTVLLRDRSRITREALLAAQRERAVVGDLQASEKRFRSLVQNSSDVFLILKLDGTISYQSPAVERVLGYPPGERLGRQIFELTHPDDIGFVQQVMRELAVTPDAQRTIELRTRHADGSWRDLEATGTNMVDDPVVAGIVVNYRDITERKRLERQLTHQAFHDPLTGLANRALFADRVNHALQRRTDQHALAVLLLDLDDFKTLNDSLGHAAGDEALIAVAERLSNQTRPEDTVSRLGGDEFVILLEDGDPEICGRVAHRLLESIREPFELGGRLVHLQASMGLAFSSAEIHSADELLRNADVAMYSAKQRGKGRVELFETRMREAVLSRLELRGDLERAIEQQQFGLRYQPIFDLASGRVSSFEALIRWRHPARGEVAPSEFIPLAEETGLIVPIGRWVLEHACAQARAWADAGRDDLSICVNLSSRQLRDPELVPTVARALARSGLNPDRLVIELTESGMMEDDEGRLGALRALGVHLSLDDFGTGYSSLSSLSRFPIEILKIDQTFIALLGAEGEENALVRSVVQLGSAMRMRTVAEGIERPEQLARVRALGCTHGQGFLLARPMDAISATRLATSGDLLDDLLAAAS